MDMNQLIEAGHLGQYRNAKDTPYTDHLRGVASVLLSAQSLTREIRDEQLVQDMINAALGHDLIEDTYVTEEDIVSAAGERTLSLIKELTNPVDDAHTDEYMAQLSSASEEARLVKYADLIENTLSVSYNLFRLEKEWVETFYLPILNRTESVLRVTEFEDYPETALLMRGWLFFVTNLLEVKKSNRWPVTGE
ncbi:MAG: hypothetical protein IKN17_10550 [Ruminococcus sp.]|nr:hypothetical protein [Ruminococcus sp.]